MKVIYIAGPFRDQTTWAIETNVRRAEALALEVWRLGAAVLCPHMNTRFFQGLLADEVFLDGDIEMMLRCDAVLTTSDWGKSAGACEEVRVAEERDLPVFHDIGELDYWLRFRCLPE